LGVSSLDTALSFIARDECLQDIDLGPIGTVTDCHKKETAPSNHEEKDRERRMKNGKKPTYGQKNHSLVWPGKNDFSKVGKK
jgi:hypothetical protein